MEDELVSIDYLAFRKKAGEKKGKELPHDHVVSYSDLDDDSEVEKEVNAEILHCNIVPNLAPATVMHWLKQLDHVQRWSQNKEFYNKEFRKDDKLIPRLKTFISHRTRTAARKVLDRRGQEIIKHPRYRTVNSWAHELASIVAHIHKDDLSDAEGKRLRESLTAHVGGLVKKFGLNTKKIRRIAFDVPEVRLLLKSALSSDKNFDTAVQFAALLLTFFYTGARPGTLLRTEIYKTHIKIRDVAIHRVVSQEGVMKGFEARLKLKHWKGYNNGGAYDLLVKVGTVGLAKNLIFDYGSTLTAHLYRLGAFGNVSPEDLWSKGVPGYIEEFKDQPVFRTHKQAGAGLKDEALSASGFAGQFRKHCRKAGLDTIREDVGAEDADEEARMSCYTMRRTTATRLYDKVGAERAQRMLGQRVGTSTLMEVYDTGTASLNLTSVMLDDHAVDDLPDVMQPFLTIGDRRGAQDRDRSPLSVLIDTDPQLEKLASDLLLLQTCQKMGSDEWMTSPSFAIATDTEKPWASTEIVDLILSTHNALRSRLRYWAAAKKREAWASAADVADLDLQSNYQERLYQQRIDDNLNIAFDLPKEIKEKHETQKRADAELKQNYESMQKRLDTQRLAQIKAERNSRAQATRAQTDPQVVVLEVCEPLGEDLDDEDSWEDEAIEEELTNSQDEESPDDDLGDGAEAEGTDATPIAETANAAARLAEPIKWDDKKAWFFELCSYETAKGKVCPECVADPTVGASDKRYEGRGYSHHVDPQNLFHTAMYRLWRYLSKNTTSMHFPYAFRGGPETEYVDLPQCFKCAFCDDGDFDRADDVTDHIHEEHMDDIPVRYHDAWAYLDSAEKFSAARHIDALTRYADFGIQCVLASYPNAPSSYKSLGKENSKEGSKEGSEGDSSQDSLMIGTQDSLIIGTQDSLLVQNSSMIGEDSLMSANSDEDSDDYMMGD